MPPVGLLAIAALGLVLVYALPDRMRETGQYHLVRVDDRYRADLEVIRSSAARIEAPPQPVRKKRTKALAPREAKASIRALGGSVMSRPVAPLDRAATVARRQMISMQRDFDRVQARRAAQARRRAVVGFTALFAASVAWGFTAASAWPMWPAVAASTVFGGIAVAGRRAVRAQVKADARLVPVAREVAVAATAVEALQRVAVERVQGHEVRPSELETQAIEVVTSERLSPEAPVAPSVSEPEADRDPGWSPGMLPIPTYTLKPQAKTSTPRPITEDDLEAGTRAAKRAALEREAARTPELPAVEPEASTQTLEDILQRRRRRSA